MNIQKQENKKLDLNQLIDEEIGNFDRSTLEAKEHLSPDMWENELLKSEVKDSLKKIANDFFEGLGLDVEIQDIVMTGSLANYNWSEYSDIDLHIIIDFSHVDENFDLVKGFFDAKKNIWNRLHKILIRGYEVEVYVQDIAEPHTSTGIYSIITNEWLVKPEKELTDINWDDVGLKVESFISQIDGLNELFQEERYEETLMYASRLKERIAKLRKAGLETGGEFSVENLAFKVLRRTGKIKDIIDIKNISYDKSLSVDNAKKFTDKPMTLGYGKPAY